MTQTYRLYSTHEDQEALAEEIASRLDEAMHLEGCYIDPNDTHCVCVVGKLRAVLPQCEARLIDYPGKPLRCLRIVHPSTPDRHVFAEA